VCRLASSQVQGIRLVHNSRTLPINPVLLAMQPEAEDPNSLQSLTNDNDTGACQLEESRRDPLVMQIVVRRDLLNVSTYYDLGFLAAEAMLHSFDIAHYLWRVLHFLRFYFPRHAEVRGSNSIHRSIVWTCSGHIFSTIAHLSVLASVVYSH